MYLPRKNLEQKAKELKNERHILKHSNDRLLKRIGKLTVRESFEISETRDVIISVVNKHESRFPPYSPKHLLCEQQKKICQLKKKSSMCWHSVMIQQCLNIYLKSPGQMDFLHSYFFLYMKKNFLSNYHYHVKNTRNVNWSSECANGVLPSTESPIFSNHYPQILHYEM